jgi:hypothetical protein
MSDWLTSHPHARTIVDEAEVLLELPEKFVSFMRLVGSLEALLGREPEVYELMPDNFRHAWSETFSAALDAATNGNGRKWEDIAQQICQQFESALQIDNATPWPDKLERDRIYWETIARHAANLVEWCGDDSPISDIEAHMVDQMRGRIGS